MTPNPAYLTAEQLWELIQQEVEGEVAKDSFLHAYLHTAILNHDSLSEMLACYLANKLECRNVEKSALQKLFLDAHHTDSDLEKLAAIDLVAVSRRDAAWHSHSATLLFFKGYQALQSYRVAHFYWQRGRHYLALLLQSRISEVFGVDIHPAAKMGKAIFFDHAHGIVIGETARVEDHVSMLHGVTLGGTGKATGKRHPTIRSGVLISAGAKILGDIEVGEGATVAASSVVLSPVPPYATVAGIPARVVGQSRTPTPAHEMSYQIDTYPECQE
jgi:serine O-acetyltransferase